MEKFTNDELSLINNIVNLILKKDQKFKLYNESFLEPHAGPFHTERLLKQISYDKADFFLYFDKWYINEKPTLKSKISSLFDNSYKDPYPESKQLRRQFQKGEERSWSIASYDAWDKQEIVKGFTVSDADEKLYFHNSKTNQKLYIQTNDINIAIDKTNKFFFNLLMDAMERIIKPL